MLPSTLKPLFYTGGRILLGAVFVGLGLWLDHLNQIKEEIYSESCQGLHTWVVCTVVRVTLLDLGITGLSWWFITFGLILIVLFDYVANFTSRVLAFAADYVAGAKDLLIDLLQKNKLSKSDLDEVFRSIWQYYTGYNDPEGGRFGNFLLQLFMQIRLDDGGFWRRSYTSTVDVRQLSPPTPLDPSRYLEWKEFTTFKVVTPEGKGKYLHTSHSSVYASEDDIENLIANWNYIILRGDEVIFSFASQRHEITKQSVTDKKGYRNKHLHVYFKDGKLYIDYKQRINVSERETEITVDELSIIRSDDTTYELALVEATEGLRFRFELPAGYEIIAFAVSPRDYHRKSKRDVRVGRGKRNASITTSKWVLPGIATSLVWRKQEGRAEAAGRSS